jgi:hypothetical protein
MIAFAVATLENIRIISQSFVIVGYEELRIRKFKIKVFRTAHLRPLQVLTAAVDFGSPITCPI